jgi:hypothetical protein
MIDVFIAKADVSSADNCIDCRPARAVQWTPVDLNQTGKKFS